MDLIMQDAQRGFAEAIEYLKKELARIQTGRATTALVESVPVVLYGVSQPLKNIATLSTPDPSTIMVQPFDKGGLNDIDKAINEANLGLSVRNDGNLIYISVPPLSAERREEIAKTVSAKGEEARISIRGHRQTAREKLEQLKKDGELTEDDWERAKKDLDKQTEDTNKDIEERIAAKENEIKTV